MIKWFLLCSLGHNIVVLSSFVDSAFRDRENNRWRCSETTRDGV